MGQVIAVSGVKSSGKTTLIEGLLPELTGRGLRVATVKHDGHRFEADRPGTDSFRHLRAGAYGSAVFDGEKFQLVKREPVDEQTLIACFPEADLILLEGFKDSRWPKLEILRRAVSEEPVCELSALLALVTDWEPERFFCPVFRPEDRAALADLLLDYVRPRPFSAILLAGGYSSRMGSSKAELPFAGTTMLEHQVRRLRQLGVEDILLSGYEAPLPGTRFVPDAYPHRGPLSGIHAGLAAARHPACLVMSVDAPLVPLFVLDGLLRTHTTGVTAVEHGGQPEPLIAVYDRDLATLCGELLQGERSSVRRLFDAVGVHPYPCELPEPWLSNCNTPGEYRALLAAVQR